MKKAIAIVCCLLWTAAFAQNIPAESLDTYRNNAYLMFMEGDTVKAVDLYKQLALSGDALSGYQLYDLYSQGKGVTKNPQEAEKWRSLAETTLIAQRAHAKAVERLFEEKPLTFQEVLNESGRLIEQGGREKNIAIAVGVAGGAVGGALVTVGMTQQSTPATVIGGIIAGGCGLAAFILEIVSNRHIKQGGEMMRRVKISGDGISVSF